MAHKSLIVAAVGVVVVVAVLTFASAASASTAKPVIRPDQAPPPPPPPDGSLGSALIGLGQSLGGGIPASNRTGVRKFDGGSLPTFKVCRAPNGKDVFANDMVFCDMYFKKVAPGRAWNCNDCGKLWSKLPGETRGYWPWERDTGLWDKLVAGGR